MRYRDVQYSGEVGCAEGQTSVFKRARSKAGFSVSDILLDFPVDDRWVTEK